MVESVKYLSISEKEIRKRVKFVGIELLEQSAANGKSCGIYLGHYANWEWVSSFPLWTDTKLIKPLQLYHPLENPIFDKLIGYTRERWGGCSVPINESIRHFVRYQKEGIPLAIGFIADQVPLYSSIHYWTNFLNHPETPVFTGPERLIKKFDMDAYYLDVQRIKRGHYKATFVPLDKTPDENNEYIITERYNRMMERTIMRQPSYWLWTHNRWKRTKKEWEEIKLYYEIQRRRKIQEAQEAKNV